LNANISQETASAIHQAMQPNPSQRFHDIEALRAALEPATPVVFTQPVIVQAGMDQGGKTQESEVRPKNYARWLPWMVGLAILVVLVVVLWPDGSTSITQTETALEAVPETTLTPTITPTSRTPTLTPKRQTPTNTSAATLTTTPQPPSPTSPPTIGSTQISPKDGMVLAYIPEGEFTMGSEDGNFDEKPAHIVFLDAYWMDQNEVTNAMFALFLSELGNQSEGGFTWLDVNHYDNFKHIGSEWIPEMGFEEHPVIEVTWHGARAYCDWAGRRLPTEAEWEKAARGEEGFIYSWGNDFECKKGNADDEANFDNYVVPDGVGCDGFIQTAPVGSFPGGASPYGLLDMTGNIWEWVFDWYGSRYFQSSPTSNPHGPSSGDSRVIRGGSWSNKVSDLRTTYRGWVNPSLSINDIGFRCALTAD
jgi:formylglycine-generating enzyme required for sulfatase activity